MGILSAIIFVPTIGAVLVLAIPKNRDFAIKYVAILTSFISLLLSSFVLIQYDSSIQTDMVAVQMQFVERYQWIQIFNVEYFLGIDGINVSFLFLSTLVFLIGIFVSWKIKESVKGYFSLFLLLETGVLGVFCALDLFLFNIFWGFTLVPVYFLIGFWGGKERDHASIKFFVYNLFGLFSMILAMLVLYFNAEPHTFNIFDLISNNQQTLKFQLLVYFAFFLSAAVRIPLVPFHSWLPVTLVEAPVAVSAVIAGVFIKMGIYILLRLSYPILPAASKYFAAVTAVLGVFLLIYSAFVAMSQSDLKKKIAYACISFMGFILAGASVFTHAGLAGSLMHAFNHGIIAVMLFLLVGILEEISGDREIEKFGGLGLKIPKFTFLTALAIFAALGLPGTGSFVSQILILIGTFELFPIIAFFIIAGILLTGAYFLLMIRKMFFGSLAPGLDNISDTGYKHILSIAPLCVIIIFLGLYPSYFLGLLNSSLSVLQAIIK